MLLSQLVELISVVFFALSEVLFEFMNPSIIVLKSLNFSSEIFNLNVLLDDNLVNFFL